MTKMTKTLTAIAAAATLAVAAVAAPQPAQARGGAIAAGIIGGLAAGAIIGAAANGPYYGLRPYYGYPVTYGPGPVYYGGPGCYWTHQRFWDGWGWHVAARAGLRLGSSPKCTPNEFEKPGIGEDSGLFRRGVNARPSNFRHIKPASFTGAGTGFKIVSHGGRPRPTPTLEGKPYEEDHLRACGGRDHRRRARCPRRLLPTPAGAAAGLGSASSAASSPAPSSARPSPTILATTPTTATMPTRRIDCPAGGYWARKAVARRRWQCHGTAGRAISAVNRHDVSIAHPPRLPWWPRRCRLARMAAAARRNHRRMWSSTAAVGQQSTFSPFFF